MAKQSLSGLIRGPGPNSEIIAGCDALGNKIVAPLRFMGSTVTSFSCSLGIGPTEESSLSVELVNDCKVPYNPSEPEGDWFTGTTSVGSPVFFSTKSAMGFCGTETTGFFKFGGILQSYTANQGSGGLTFSARVTDPRSLLNGVTLVTGNSLQGPLRQKNYYNTYAYYEYNVLDPSRKNPFVDTGKSLLPDSPGYGSEITVKPLGDPDISDCSIFGDSNSNSNGMPYANIINALLKMDPYVFSPNFGEEFSPALAGRDQDVAYGGPIKNTKHAQNVFKLDISEVPNPPLYMRAPGPTITLMELITNVCETMGYEFHVTLEESTNFPNTPHKIKIHTRDVKAVPAPSDFKSVIVDYNGQAVELNYGRELNVDNGRTILYGEQKHEMYETINIKPFFGEDKNGEPILPYRKAETDACGYYIKIYLDDLNGQLRCPLFESGTGAPVNRQVEVSEWTLRTALGSEESWKRYTFNKLIDEDFCQIVRYNFPDLANEYTGALVNFWNNISGVVPGANGALPDFLNYPAAKTIEALEERTKQQLNLVYQYISNIASTYYGKQYVAVFAKNLCVAKSGYYDLDIVGTDGNTTVQGDTITYTDPCTNTAISLPGRIFRPPNYTHIPTNDGGYIETCGRVLGLGGRPDEIIYLDFFRNERGLVGSFCRFDSKTITLVNRTESMISEEGFIPASDTDGTLVPSSVSQYVSIFGEIVPSSVWPTIDQENTMFTFGVCGNLDKTRLSEDAYIAIHRSGEVLCSPPVTGVKIPTTEDVPQSIFIKTNVSENIYLDPTGVLEFKETYRVQVPSPTADVCCGKWQYWNPLADCYWAIVNGPPPDEECIEWQTRTNTVSHTGLVLVPFTVEGGGCFKNYCDSQQDYGASMLSIAWESLMNESKAVLSSSGVSQTDFSLLHSLMAPSKTFCRQINDQDDRVKALVDVFDQGSNTNAPIHAAADIPVGVAIAVKSNIETYGPWTSQNFYTSAAGVEVVHDTDFNPWFFGGVDQMNRYAEGVIKEKQKNVTELETGSLTYPYWPQVPLGFINGGPNLTSINVSMGSNGVTSQYNFKSYTPRFGGLKTLEKQQMVKTVADRQRIRKLAQDKARDIDNIKRKTGAGGTGSGGVARGGGGGGGYGGGGGGGNTAMLGPVDNNSTTHRLIFGSMRDFGVITSGTNIIGTGDRTTVGFQSAYKSVNEMRYDYENKAFVSLDALYSPVTTTAISGSGYEIQISGAPAGSRYSIPHMPIYTAFSGIKGSASGIYINPNPPVKYSGSDVNNLAINRNYSDPYTNPFKSGEHHFPTSGAGHSIDVVARGQEPPERVVMNFYGQSEWDQRYSKDYRFLGLKGPLVLHQWGYDTQGKPIPNAIDDLDQIRKSGVFVTGVANSGLTDYFLKDWLQKPSSWPAAPIDLRFDRNRGMWVSPPQHKIVVVEAKESISAYGSGSGLLINEREGVKYNTDITDKTGKKITSEMTIKIEDRIGSPLKKGEKKYAYFDSFTSTYLMLGGGGAASLTIGKFCNQWPSLSNVKDPANAVKKVVLYQNTGENPWDLTPQMTEENGIPVPVTVDAINLFSNVAAHEYQTKWCALLQNGDKYYLVAAES